MRKKTRLGTFVVVFLISLIVGLWRLDSRPGKLPIHCSDGQCVAEVWLPHSLQFYFPADAARFTRDGKLVVKYETDDMGPDQQVYDAGTNGEALCQVDEVVFITDLGGVPKVLHRKFLRWPK